MNVSKSRTTCILLLMIFFLFSPFVASAAEPKAGDVISSGNIDQYEDYFPSFIARYIKDGWGFKEPVVIHVRESEPFPVGKRFLEMTKNNVGKVTLTDDGLLEGYPNQGLPFMEPKEPNLALKIMWNRYYAWFVDDWSMPGGTYSSFNQRKGGSVTHTTASYDCLRFSNRTMVPPVPEHQNPRQLFWATILDSETPPNKDMATLSWRYKNPQKDDDMWTYLPTLRRTLRLVSSERANPIRGTPLTWDDIFGFDGQIPKFEYKLLRTQKIMVLAHQNRWLHEVPGKKWEHPIVYAPEEPWELKDSYCIEVTPKDPRYPMAKRIIWVMPENWKINYAEVFDKAGAFWKGYFQSQKLAMAKSNDVPAGKEPYCFTMTSGITDFKTFYWTLGYFSDVKLNSGLDPNLFRPQSLGTF
ncbi:MAG: DUF1329 domain-containing protein [Desulfobacterales bacterium]